MIQPPRPELLLTQQQKRILWHLRSAGPTPRVKLAEIMGSNGASMTRVTQQLAALGLVEDRDSAGSASRGRPMIPLAIAGGGGWSVGATLHPGWLEIAVVDFAGTPLLRDSIPFHDSDPRLFARALDERLRVLAGQHGFMRGKFLGLGVAVAGYALGGDRNRRKMVDWLAPWNNVPLDDVLGDVLDMPVWIENDGTAAALAEYYQPQILGRHRSVLVFFLGHGVGAGLIAERDVFPGEHRNAGEVGRLFPGHGPRPSGIDLMRTLREAGVAIASLSDLDGLMGQHAPMIDAWVERVAQQLELAMLSGIVWLDPGAVVISGALPAPILQDLANRLNQINRRRDSGYLAATPHIYPSPLGSAAVVIGAALAPIHAITADHILS
jgi:predicted NBD/HSP70 family sugar kinase